MNKEKNKKWGSQYSFLTQILIGIAIPLVPWIIFTSITLIKYNAIDRIEYDESDLYNEDFKKYYLNKGRDTIVFSPEGGYLRRTDSSYNPENKEKIYMDTNDGSINISNFLHLNGLTGRRSSGMFATFATKVAVLNKDHLIISKDRNYIDKNHIRRGGTGNYTDDEEDFLITLNINNMEINHIQKKTDDMLQWFCKIEGGYIFNTGMINDKLEVTNHKPIFEGNETELIKQFYAYKCDEIVDYIIEKTNITFNPIIKKTKISDVRWGLEDHKLISRQRIVSDRVIILPLGEDNLVISKIENYNKIKNDDKADEQKDFLISFNTNDYKYNHIQEMTNSMLQWACKIEGGVIFNTGIINDKLEVTNHKPIFEGNENDIIKQPYVYKCNEIFDYIRENTDIKFTEPEEEQKKPNIVNNKSTGCWETWNMNICDESSLLGDRGYNLKNGYLIINRGFKKGNKLNGFNFYDLDGNFISGYHKHFNSSKIYFGKDGCIGIYSLKPKHHGYSFNSGWHVNNFCKNKSIKD